MATLEEVLTELTELLSRYDGALSISGGSKILTLNRSAGTDTAAMVFQQAGAEHFRAGQFAAGTFAIQRSPTGAAVDYTNVISIARDTGAVTMSGLLGIAAGTAGAPSLHVTGDTNTGLHSPGADQIALVAGGTARITATTSGATVTGNLETTGNIAAGYASIVSNFPGLDMQDNDAGYTTHNRIRVLRNGSILAVQTFSANAAALVSTDFSAIITSGGIDSWSWRVLGTQKLLLNAAGLTAIGVYDATTANAANVNVASSGLLARSTSSLQYKTGVEPADHALLRDTLMAIEPIWYRSLCANDDPDLSWWGIGAEALAELDPRFVAWRTTEEAEETYVERWMGIEADPETGEPIPVWHEEERTRPVLVPLPREKWTAEGVAYDRLTVALIAVAQDQQAAIADLTTRVAALEAA